MLFSSLVFIFYFLPAILLAYYLAPKSWKNYILLLFSLVFYAWGGVSYSAVFVISVVLNYFFARGITNSKSRSKVWLRGGIVFNIALLFSFKYLVFLIENIKVVSAFFEYDIVLFDNLKILLPLGISFYTFQQMSMLWDIYRTEEKLKIKFSETALYIGFFPQLVAGPIVRYNDIIHQIRTRKETISLFNSGIERFIIGLFKKVIVANACGLLIDTILKNDVEILSTSAAWLGIVAYAFQIYFDFSGYSDMAIGLGRMFGFEILENFNFPYISKNIREFWRRWHISLSTWFRDYVYIPLGGNKSSVNKTYRNLLIVFLLTGFWHGATWSFVFWGVFHGLFIIIERLGFSKILDKMPSVVSWAYTFLIVLVGWVFFRIEDFNKALSFVGVMFDFSNRDGISGFNFLNAENSSALILAAIMSAPILARFKENKLSSSVLFIKNIGLILMFLYVVMAINFGSYNPFIYFKF
jgi:alginate O-acetyltransferase complex protein AlgI